MQNNQTESAYSILLKECLAIYSAENSKKTKKNPKKLENKDTVHLAMAIQRGYINLFLI